MKNISLLILLILLVGCKNQTAEKEVKTVAAKEKPKAVIPEKEIYKYGYNLNNYKVINKTIKFGESFGEILERNHISYPRVLEIAKASKKVFDVRRIKAGIPYTILAEKDCHEAQVFIYKHSKVKYTVLDFKNSIVAYSTNKPVKTVTKYASGVINSSLSQAIEDQGLSNYLAYSMSDIYAWTVDFFRLQQNDKFKLIYDELYVDDTISVGYGNIKAAYFEHGGKPFYSFRFSPDSKLQIPEYFDDNSNNLRRQFLKSPVKFSRISSRFNRTRRIAFYGYKIRPHLGTDFAASVGTPIMSTANGRVIESKYKGGNGNYVKIRHNSTYNTQYLHMSKRLVKVGDVVKQGDIIGYVGMTGNTSGPHVCYRFWKNGKQVNPLAQKLPMSSPIKKDIKQSYLSYIKPLKSALDSIHYPEDEGFFAKSD